MLNENINMHQTSTLSDEKQGAMIIWASSRNDGNTARLIKLLNQEIDAKLINISDLNMSFYDYKHDNQEDDFIPLAEEMVKVKLVVLVTPVYWYSMSGQMKMFIDRWSDLMTIRKDLGRELSGSQLLLVSCGSYDFPGEAFEKPIEQTTGYMDMKFEGYWHTWIEDGKALEPIVLERIEEIKYKIEELTKNNN